VALVLLLAPPLAPAATILRYSGPVYDLPPTGHTTCVVWTCTDYMQSERIVASFRFALRLPPNLALADMAPQVLDWSANDGVNTIASTDGNARLGEILVSTDGGGNVTAWRILLERFQATPHFVNGRLDVIESDSTAPFDSGVNNAFCMSFGRPQPSSPPDTCLQRDGDTNTSDARAVGSIGTWAVATEVDVPALAPYGLASLAALLAGVGMAALARRRNAGLR
jgi:hypothetical protein